VPVIAFMHVVVGVVIPSKGEGRSVPRCFSFIFFDDGVFLFSVTIVNRLRGDTITPLFAVDVYL